MKTTKKKWKSWSLYVVAIQVLFVFAIHADVVVLDNGETLSGTFSRIREDTLVFRTSLEGQMMTPLSNVKTVSATTPFYLGMNDGRVYYGRLAVRDEKQVIEPLDGGDPVVVKITDVKETLPIPTPPGGMTESEEKKWSLNMAPGVQWRSDGEAAVEPVLRLDAAGKLKNWDISGDAVIERSDPERFPAYLKAHGEAIYGDEGGVYPFLGVDFERDLDRALSAKSALNLGIYQALTAESARSFSLMAALSLEQERRRQEEGVLSGEEYDTETRLGLRLGLRFYHLFTNGHSVSESLTLFGAPSDAFWARSDAMYMVPLNNRLRLRFDLSLNYESSSLLDDSDMWSAVVGAGIYMSF